MVIIGTCSSHGLIWLILVHILWLFLIGTYSLSFPVDRRQGSTDSDEHAWPKKKTTTKKKKRAPSTSPSASDPDDADYVGEEEDESAPR